MQASDEENGVEVVLLLVITLTCLGISFYATAIGYEDAFGLAGALAFALMIVSALLLLNFKLRTGIRRGVAAGTLTTLTLLYLLVTGASFLGNFNAFYSKFMRDELIKNELQEKIAAFQDIGSRSIAELTGLQGTTIRTDVESMLTELVTQATTAQNQGFGPEVEAILVRIENRIGGPITRLKCASKASAAIEQCLNEYVKTIRAKLDNSAELVALNEAQRKKLAPEIGKRVSAEIQHLIAANDKLTSAKSANARSDAVAALQVAVNEYLDIGSATRAALKEKEFPYQVDMKVKNDEIGKISHSIESAQSYSKHWAPWVAAFCALMIDLIVPLIIFFVTTRSVGTPTRDRRAPIDLTAGAMQ